VRCSGVDAEFFAAGAETPNPERGPGHLHRAEPGAGRQHATGAFELAIEERSVEANVVRNENTAAKSFAHVADNLGERRCVSDITRANAVDICWP
jgi:hypothetical protein